MDLTEDQQKEKTLTDNGLNLFVRLNANKFEWFPKESDAIFVFPRFTSREQATDYAIHQILKQKMADETRIHD